MSGINFKSINIWLAIYQNTLISISGNLALHYNRLNPTILAFRIFCGAASLDTWCLMNVSISNNNGFHMLTSHKLQTTPYDPYNSCPCMSTIKTNNAIYIDKNSYDICYQNIPC